MNTRNARPRHWPWGIAAAALGIPIVGPGLYAAITAASVPGSVAGVGAALGLVVFVGGGSWIVGVSSLQAQLAGLALAIAGSLALLGAMMAT